jgi:hypothetical protein
MTWSGGGGGLCRPRRRSTLRLRQRFGQIDDNGLRLEVGGMADAARDSASTSNHAEVPPTADVHLYP